MACWHLTFVQMDEETQTFNTLLTLSSDDKNVKKIFGIAKEQYNGNAKKLDCILDLRNEQGDILDDLPLTYTQMNNLAQLLGYELTAVQEVSPSLRLL